MTSTASNRGRTPHLVPGSPPGAEVALRWLEGLLALGAFGGAAGFLLLGDDMLREMTAELPFASPVLAGVALGLVNGVLPTVVLVGSLQHRWWARRGHAVVGAALIGWVVVQVGFLGWPPAVLQWAYLGYGTLILALAARLSAPRGPAGHSSVGAPPS